MVLVYKWSDYNQSLMQKSLSFMSFHVPWEHFLKIEVEKRPDRLRGYRTIMLTKLVNHCVLIKLVESGLWEQTPYPMTKTNPPFPEVCWPCNCNKEKGRKQEAKSMKMLCPWLTARRQTTSSGGYHCLSHNIKRLLREWETASPAMEWTL